MIVQWPATMYNVEPATWGKKEKGREDKGNWGENEIKSDHFEYF